MTMQLIDIKRRLSVLNTWGLSSEPLSSATRGQQLNSSMPEEKLLLWITGGGHQPVSTIDGDSTALTAAPRHTRDQDRSLYSIEESIPRPGPL